MEKKQIKLFEEIQTEWTCPITQTPMIEPVLTVDGHTYEKKAIEEWIKKSNKSPATGLTLESTILIPNVILKSIIQKFNLFKRDLNRIQGDMQLRRILRSTEEQLQKKQGLLLQFFDYIDSNRFLNIVLKGQKQELKSMIKVLQKRSNSIIGQNEPKFRVKNKIGKMKDFVKGSKNLLPNSQYLFDVFYTGSQVNKRYTKDEYLGLYNLDHHPVDIDMNKFLSHNWFKLQMINLIGCGINDQKWFLLIKSYKKLPNLKMLYLMHNQIRTVKEYHLQDISQLKYINFGQDLQSSNPLLAQTKNVLNRYKLANPIVTVLFLE